MPKKKQADVEVRLAAFISLCKESGVQVTHQRTEVYRELARTHEHPDAETVYRRVRRRIPSISLDTVYRTLRTFEERGVVQRVGVGGYRTRFDANMATHHHFVCRECGLIDDFHSEALDGFQPPREVTKLGDVTSVHIELRGICGDCRGKRER